MTLVRIEGEIRQVLRVKQKSGKEIELMKIKLMIKPECYQNYKSNTAGIRNHKDIKLCQYLPAEGAGVIAMQNKAKVKMSSCEKN